VLIYLFADIVVLCPELGVIQNAPLFGSADM
jgi:hypothetical protein